MSKQTEPYICSFCKKTERQVRKIIVGGGGGPFICDECVELCSEILHEEGVEFTGLLQLTPRRVTEELGFRPVFAERKLDLVANSCFFLGPFSEPFDTIYRDHVVPALSGAGFTVTRADEIFSTNVVIEDVWRGVLAASLIVADVSNRNPNVMYEIGMAHTVGKPVLLVSQSANDLPFDLRHRRCVVYDYTPRGCKKLEDEIARTVEFVRSGGAPGS